MTLKINVGELFRSEPGTKKEYELDLPVFEDEEFHLEKDQKIFLTGYKIDKGIAVSVDPDTIKGIATCVKTLKEFTLESELYSAERQFYLQRPDDLEENEEFDQIDNKTFEVDLEDMVREAVFLGLPTVIVSPEGEKTHVELKQDQAPGTTKAFADLKNLLND